MEFSGTSEPGGVCVADTGKQNTTFWHFSDLRVEGTPPHLPLNRQSGECRTVSKVDKLESNITILKDD